MDWNFKKLGPTVALTMVGLGSTGFAAAKNGNMDQCAPQPGAACYSIDTPQCDYCLGPENVAGNPSVRPKTCNGDVVITVAGFYWNAHEDGLEYALQNNVPLVGTDTSSAPLNNLIDAEYMTPDFKWDFGFKLGIGYNFNHDGWDVNVLWTRYHGKASSSVEGEASDNQSLIPLWSAFASSATGPVLYASSIDTHWKLDLNLVDIELGREFWASKFLTLRPHMGIRIGWIKQDYEVEHRGGSWNAVTAPSTAATNNEVNMHNNFKGVGVRGGLDSTWHIGRGFAIFGNAALSIVYGRFSVDQEENNRLASAPFSKTEIMETENSYRASKAMTDLALGIEWSTMFSNCNYGFTLALAWEHHMFFNQNQLWKVNRVGVTGATAQPNNTGVNVFQKDSGDLSTQGWTLTATFDF